MDHGSQQFDECCCTFYIGLSGLPDFTEFSETLLCGIGTKGRDHLGTTKFISREYGNRFSPAPKYSLVTVYKESVAADGGV